MGTVNDSHCLALTAIVTVGYQLFFFIITSLLKFDKVTHLSGSTNFVMLAILTLVLKGSWHFRQVVLSFLAVIWGLRLAISDDMANIFKVVLMCIWSPKICSYHNAFSPVRMHISDDFMILQWGEDRRFDEMRGNLGKLAIFWTFQTVWAWTVSLPVTIVNASDRNPSLEAKDVIGWIMWSIGIFIEATAYQQKLMFKNSPENRGTWCNLGLWKYSRHPNYLGEILLWWGNFCGF